MIINYLIKALCEKEKVYVNNLGLFRKEYEPAHIKDGLITPPGYKVVFDPDYDGNGFAFTMFVSQKGGLLITEATTQIDQWVEQLKTALDHNKSVSFENFGTFAKNEKGVITYHCDRIAELNVDYEGMEPVELRKKRDEDEKEVEVAEDVKVVNDFTEEKKETEEKEEGKEEHPDKRKAWIVWLVVLLLIALLAACTYYFRTQLKELYHQYFGKENTEKVAEKPIQVEPVATPLDSCDYTLTTDSLESDITEETVNAENMEEQLVPATVSQLPEGEKFFIDYEKGKYYVIVGSFRSEKEVRQHIKERKLELYNPKVVLQPHSKNMRICIGVFDTEADADSFGRGTKLNYWVLK